MGTAAVLLAGLAVALAWPVPVVLSRAGWVSRKPRLAMVLWQAVALVGGISMLGALLCWGLAPYGTDLATAFREFESIWTGGGYVTGAQLIHFFALSACVLLFAHLVSTLIFTGLRMARRRRRHIEALRLVAQPAEGHENQLVVDSQLPLAYCLPSHGGSITVVTDGILDALSPAELEAVLAHERAHIAQRHDFLVWAFSAWRAALPWLPTSRLALDAVSELIEYLADDRAALSHSRKDIARALLHVAEASCMSTTPATAEKSAAESASPMQGRSVRRAVRLVSAVPQGAEQNTRA